MSIEAFGEGPAGEAVTAATLSGDGLTARVLSWGATLQDLRLDGAAQPLVLGATTLAPYLGPMRHFGAIVGRVANRIAGARAVLDGRALAFPANDGANILHGGPAGTSLRNWRMEAADGRACRLTLTLPDGEMGFPGRLDIAAEYRIAAGALELEIAAETEAPTFCNLAHHGYWNLDGTASAQDHLLEVAADTYLPVDAVKIPEGPPRPVAGTTFDFRAPRSLAQAGGQYDHNFCLAGARRPCGFAARLTGPETGITLTVETTEPGLQVYDAERMRTAPAPGLTGAAYGPFSGIALEPQGWPDAPNRPDFPPVTLRPGERYRQLSKFVPARG